MDYRKSNAPTNTVTRDMMKLSEETGNVYETVAIISKRANQISVEMKQDLEKKLPALCFLVNGVVQKITGGQIRMAYLVFAGVALVNVLLVLMVNEHKYNRDWMAAHKK